MSNLEKLRFDSQSANSSEMSREKCENLNRTQTVMNSAAMYSEMIRNRLK